MFSRPLPKKPNNNNNIQPSMKEVSLKELGY